MKALFIVNPLSETVARKGSVLETLAASHNEYEHASLFTVNFLSPLNPLIDKAIKNEYDHIFVEGGDGTAQGILTAFLRRSSEFSSFPKFSLLRGGMTNQVAKTIGLKNRKTQTVKNVLDNANRKSLESIIEVPMLRIQSAGFPDYFGFLFSTGAVPMITEYTKTKVHKKGIGGSSAVVAGILKGISGRANDVMSQTPLALEVMGETEVKLKSPHLGTLVTTLPSLLLGLDPFWGQEDGPLRVTIAGENTKRLYKHVLSLWLGRKTVSRKADGLLSYNANQLDYGYSGPIVLDGEPLDFGGQPFMITATKAIRFIR